MGALLLLECMSTQQTESLVPPGSVSPSLLCSQLLKAEQYSLVDKLARDFKVSDKL